MNKSLFSVWLTLAESDKSYLFSKIQELSNTYQAPSFTPHMTIFGSVYTPIEELVNITQQSIKNIQPFSIKTKGIFASEDFFKSIFIEFNLSKNPNRIYSNLYNNLKRYNNYLFYPHISLLYKDIPLEKKQEIAEILNVKSEFVINGITIVKSGNPKLGWRDIKKWQEVYTQKFK